MYVSKEVVSVFSWSWSYWFDQRVWSVLFLPSLFGLLFYVDLWQLCFYLLHLSSLSGVQKSEAAGRRICYKPAILYKVEKEKTDFRQTSDTLIRSVFIICKYLQIRKAACVRWRHMEVVVLATRTFAGVSSANVVSCCLLFSLPYLVRIPHRCTYISATACCFMIYTVPYRYYWYLFSCILPSTCPIVLGNVVHKNNKSAMQKNRENGTVK